MPRKARVNPQEEMKAKLAALDKSQAIITFSPEGIILDANENFLAAMGYTLKEIQGQHHRLFVPEEVAQSREYHEFWEKLRRGEYDAKEYKRVAKGGRDIWIQATYNPLLDKRGNVYKVIKFATDITPQKMQNAKYEGQINAISRSQAVIHFNLDGTIITANENFLGAVGYSLDEIKGKHHRMFVEPDYAGSREYSEFWEKLRLGEFEAREYKRLGKGGREIWIQASYNPIFDMSGNPFKVVKYATDITRQMQARNQAGEYSEQTLSNVQTVAAAAEEMNASITEISKNMGLSKVAVDDIVTKTRLADDASQKLQQSSQAMENVVQLIRNIAGQVNLLALNATIEAARAGDAGKGFAVVAAEVKGLAGQTSRATDDIAREIQQMQEVSQHVTESVLAISGTTHSVSDYVTSVAGAIEEQSAVTREISQNMQRAATGVSEISECVRQIAGSRL